MQDAKCSGQVRPINSQQYIIGSQEVESMTVEGLQLRHGSDEQAERMFKAVFCQKLTMCDPREKTVVSNKSAILLHDQSV